MPIAPSATAAAPAPGVITTAIPRAVAAGTSIRSVPTPVLAMTRSAGALRSSTRSTLVSARAMAPCAAASSASPGAATNRQCPSSTPETRAGSTEPSATTTGRSPTCSPPGHQACPNVAPGTGATLCQAPSPAEAAVAAMTSASASASAMVELRCSPPPTATRNFLASMTLRSS